MTSHHIHFVSLYLKIIDELNHSEKKKKKTQSLSDAQLAMSWLAEELFKLDTTLKVVKAGNKITVWTIAVRNTARDSFFSAISGVALCKAIQYCQTSDL